MLLNQFTPIVSRLPVAMILLFDASAPWLFNDAVGQVIVDLSIIITLCFTGSPIDDLS